MLGRSKTDPIKVLLADNHTMFRQGIAKVLADFGGMEIVGQTDNDERAVELARLTKPDVSLEELLGVLSARELEILLLAARGLSNRQIGASLHVAVGTVKRHLANAYQKMGVGSRGQATRMALHEEWITIQDVTDDLDGPEGNSSSEGSYSPSSSDSLLAPSSTPSNSSRETSLTSEVVPSSSTVASMRSVLRSRIRHSTSSGHLRSTLAPSASSTSTCGSKRSASPSRDSGEASSTSKSGRRRWMQRASTSLYMRGVMVTSIRTRTRSFPQTKTA